MDDRELIERHGGSAELARKLNMTKPGSVQRVNNWKTRGIPPKVKLDHPELFLNQPEQLEEQPAVA
ncbi:MULTISPECIES: hypothetical protein [unclassified Cupriavidus]|uniref:hypothetical protein n=1 Tax=unclassified Cupriavidus TaxID=2640874 RepID=UPI00313E6B58